MLTEFSLSSGNAMINFTGKYCDTQESLLDSLGFKRVVDTYVNKIKKKDSSIYKYLIKTLNIDENIIVTELIDIFKLLTVFEVRKVAETNENYKEFLKDKGILIDIIEDLYKFWRKIERYTIVQNNKVGDGFQNVNFIDANDRFSRLILSTYRKIEENIVGSKPKVYRQIPAGGNAGIILSKIQWPCPEEYGFLRNVSFIQSVMLQAPFITYPKKNTRDGVFEECSVNPFENCDINEEHWFCYPAKVGNKLAYIYFHRDYMSHGIALCNLFELAEEEEYKGKKPDILYVFGIKNEENEVKTLFYDDKNNNMLVGYVNNHEDIDYFGYMKKMILTLHNIIMINEGYLPIHGAMVNIKLKDGTESNILIMGDSGAGKSESLEAFRELSEDYISDMTIIFDDMGVIKGDKEGNILGYGTEIGAFVRLDDLDIGYAFREIDRSIFMNPDKINARLVIPITPYKDIIKGYKVDLFLYANNYNEGEEIEFFKDYKEAIEVFKSGARMAKGTTTEKGLVKSYFANPFGPVQRKEQMEILIENYFSNFFSKGIKVGQIRTCLGINGKEKEGPKNAALKLFQYIKSI